MNSHSRARVFSSILLVGSVALLASMPTSFAAAKATATPKAAAKIAPKATAKAPAKKTAVKAAPKATAKAPAKKPIATPKPKVTKAPVAGGASRGGRFANLTTVQKACLVKAGVKLPAPRPTGVRPTPNATRSPGSFGAGNTFNDPKTVAAYKNCGITLPTGGFGGGTFNSAKFQAFQKCMTAAGFQSTGGFGRYDQSDPSTVAALIKCQKSSGFTLPKPGANN
jgi:hypothetical protein